MMLAFHHISSDEQAMVKFPVKTRQFAQIVWRNRDSDLKRGISRTILDHRFFNTGVLIFKTPPYNSTARPNFPGFFVNNSTVLLGQTFQDFLEIIVRKPAAGRKK